MSIKNVGDYSMPITEQRRKTEENGSVVSMFLKVSKEQHDWLVRVARESEQSMAKIIQALITSATDQDPKEFVRGLEKSLLAGKLDKLRREREEKEREEKAIAERLSELEG